MPYKGLVYWKKKWLLRERLLHAIRKTFIKSNNYIYNFGCYIRLLALFLSKIWFMYRFPSRDFSLKVPHWYVKYMWYYSDFWFGIPYVCRISGYIRVLLFKNVHSISTLNNTNFSLLISSTHEYNPQKCTTCTQKYSQLR